MKTYIIYEIGKSCITEFMMKNGEFKYTEDAVVVGITNGKNPHNAFERLKNCGPWIKNYEFDRVVVREVGDAVYI